jgi:hypothetical protein
MYRHLFDLNVMREIIPSFELGRWFAYVSLSSMSRRFVMAAMVGAACFVLVVATYVWRAGGSLVSRLGMVITLGLGTVLMIPDLGPSLVSFSGLRVSAFDTPSEFSARILFTGLLTVALGCLAYARIAKSISHRDQVLLVTLCGAFALMLPWSAVLWNASALLASNIQFPFRFGGILTVAVAGLLGVAIDTCRQEAFSRDGRSPMFLLGLAVLVVIAAGAFAWRVPERLRSPYTVDYAITHNVDNMFRSYVARGQVAEFAGRLGTAPDSFEVALTPVDPSVRGDTIRSDADAGQCTVSAVPREPRILRVFAECQKEARIRIWQLYSPLWKIVPLGEGTYQPVLGSSLDGLMEIALSTGKHDFELIFDLRWPERAGVGVTLASMVIGIGGPVFLRLRMRMSKHRYARFGKFF